MASQVQSVPPLCTPMASFANGAPWMEVGCNETAADWIQMPFEQQPHPIKEYQENV